MLNALIQIAHDAGEAILAHYGKEAPVEQKADDSPLTLADRDSHRLIEMALAKLTPDIPLISEEGEQSLPYSERSGWKQFWLVDPMDGTKEFIKQTGQFTVNIGLVRDGVPALGVIYAPATGLLYYASEGNGAWKQEKGQPPVQIKVRGVPAPEELSIVASRDHAGQLVQKLFEKYPQAKTLSMGSSLKFCLVAEGKADIYLRDVPTMEWDTAAAHAIVREAGGVLETLEDGELPYNKEVLRNPSIVTFGHPDLRAWLA